MLDTRVLSRWELRVNGHRIEPLAVDIAEPFAATFAGRGFASRSQADADPVVFRHRHVGWGMRERIEITNHGLDPAPLVIEAVCDVDFASVFEVKERRVPALRQRSMHADAVSLRFSTTDQRRGRDTTIRLTHPASVEPGLAVWRSTLAPGETWTTCVEIVLNPARRGDRAPVQLWPR